MEPATNAVHRVVDDEPAVEAPDATAQLKKILASSHFRNSRRHQRFLTFLVMKYLDGSTADIKERVIGAEVFDREASYEVSLDPIVRVAAADLRKRLTLYYANDARVDELRIELPMGSYIPQLRWPKTYAISAPASNDPASADHHGSEAAVAVPELLPGPTALQVPASLRSGTILTVVLAALVLVGVWFVRSEFGADDRALKAFWQPVLGSGDRVLVSPGTLNSMMNAPALPPPNESWYERTKTRDHLDAHAGIAMLDVGEMIGQMHRRTIFKLESSVTVDDLRSQPAVLVGGLNNQWGMRLLSNLRYRIVYATPSRTGDHRHEESQCAAGFLR